IDELKRAKNLIAVVSGFDISGAVEDAMLALRGRRQCQLSSWRAAEPFKCVELRLRQLRIGQRQLAGWHLEVLHEVAADEIVGIAESSCRLAIRGEKESGVLNGVTREHEAPRA